MAKNYTLKVFEGYSKIPINTTQSTFLGELGVRNRGVDSYKKNNKEYGCNP